MNIEKMVENLDKILDNRENMELLMSKTEDLNDNAGLFYGSSKKLKNTMKKRLVILIIISIVVLLIIIGVLTLIILGATGVLTPKK